MRQQIFQTERKGKLQDYSLMLWKVIIWKCPNIALIQEAYQNICLENNMPNANCQDQT